MTHYIFFLAYKRTQIKCIYRTRGPDDPSSAALLHAALRQIRKTLCILSQIYTVPEITIQVRTANLTEHVVRAN